MTTIQGKNVLVVGASGAFGSEFAKTLTAKGSSVFGTSKNAESSVRLAANLEQRLLLDLESDQSIDNLAGYLNGLEAHLDGVILAAGLVAFGGVAHTPAEISQRLMQVNALGQMQLVSALTEKLAESAAAGREPFILSLSGVISEQPMAGLASYSASKTAINGFATAAGKELKKLGINWIDARPGHTESGLAERAIFGAAPNFGSGKSVSEVVSRIMAAIEGNERDLPSSAF